MKPLTLSGASPHQLILFFAFFCGYSSSSFLCLLRLPPPQSLRRDKFLRLFFFRGGSANLSRV